VGARQLRLFSLARPHYLRTKEEKPGADKAGARERRSRFGPVRNLGERAKRPEYQRLRTAGYDSSRKLTSLRKEDTCDAVLNPPPFLRVAFLISQALRPAQILQRIIIMSAPLR
jgi:hypothetical protein